MQIGSSTSGIQCPTLNVTSTYLFCTLFIDVQSIMEHQQQQQVKESEGANKEDTQHSLAGLSAEPTGAYSVVIVLTVADGTTMRIDTGATLTFGAGNSPGWSGAGAPTPAPNGPPSGPPSGGSDDKNETLIVACATVGAVCFLLIVIVVVVRMKYTLCLVRRSSRGDGRY